jgi:hypothetical protein
MFALLVAIAGLMTIRNAYAVAVGAGAEGAAQAATILGQLPFAFETAADDEIGSSIRFVARGLGYRVAVAPTAVQLHMSKRPPRPGGSEGGGTRIVDLRFVDGRDNAVSEGVDRVAVRTHYFVGPSVSHRSDVANFARVRFREVYQGIDIDYYGTNGQLEFDLTIRPGADVSRVKIAVGGGDPSLDASGGIVIGSDDGSVILQRPASYQLVDGLKRQVECAFTLNAAKEIGIVVGAYDRAKPLIVDPVVTYASYLGGKGLDVGTAIAVDAAGNMYIAGSSGSPDFPLAGAYDRNLAKGDTDIFVTKLNAQGTALVYSTYLGGGTGSERATGIAVDKSGNVYVTGNTSGSDFPTTSGAYQSGIAGGGAFVVKLGPSGNMLVYSTYVRSATANAIAVDADGNAYITGGALTGFATTPGALQPTTGNPGGTNAFVLRLNATGTAAMYATFLGGSGNDIGNAVAVDGSGNAHIGGGTTSPNFPSVVALQPAAGGARDGFIAKLNPSGKRTTLCHVSGWQPRRRRERTRAGRRGETSTSPVRRSRAIFRSRMPISRRNRERTFSTAHSATRSSPRSRAMVRHSFTHRSSAAKYAPAFAKPPSPHRNSTGMPHTRSQSTCKEMPMSEDWRERISFRCSTLCCRKKRTTTSRPRSSPRSVAAAGSSIQPLSDPDSGSAEHPATMCPSTRSPHLPSTRPALRTWSGTSIPIPRCNRRPRRFSERLRGLGTRRLSSCRGRPRRSTSHPPRTRSTFKSR